MPERTSILLRPNLSENIPDGILAIMPVKADIPAIIPTPVGLAPRYVVNKGKAGLFEMVELNMANNPEVQSNEKGVNLRGMINYTNIEREYPENRNHYLLINPASS